MYSVLKVLVLRELAVHAPTLFYTQIQAFFDNIFIAVRDSKVCRLPCVCACMRACVHVRVIKRLLVLIPL